MPQTNLTRAGTHTKVPSGTKANKARQTSARKAALVTALRESGNITLACGAAGVDRRTHYRWLDADADYRADIAEALAEAADRLEGEAHDRAILGWDEPVYQGGKLVGVIRRKSDALLMMLLRGAKPEVYGNGPRAARPVRARGTAEPEPAQVTQVTAEMLQLSGADLLAALQQRVRDIRTGKASCEPPQ